MQVGVHISRIAPPKAVESSPISQRMESSEPAGGFCLRVTLTVLLAASSPLMALPLDSAISRDEIVIVGSAPPMFWTASTLFATTTAMAPAFWAFFTLTAKPQTPRSTSEILPAVAAAFTNGVQPFEVDGSAAPSSARTTSPVIPGPITGGPNVAVPAGQVWAIDAGELITTTRAPEKLEHAPTVRTGPGESVPAPLIRSTVSPQISE